MTNLLTTRPSIKQVVAIGRSQPDDAVQTATGEEDETIESTPSHLPEPSASGSSARIRWAQLLARIFQVLPLLCPSCGGDMRILAFLTDPPVVQGILLHLDLPTAPHPSPQPGARLKVTSSWIRRPSSISPSPIRFQNTSSTSHPRRLRALSRRLGIAPSSGNRGSAPGTTDHVWTVFSADGSGVRRVLLPDIVLRDVRDGLAYGTRSNELDVETVVVYDVG